MNDSSLQRASRVITLLFVLTLGVFAQRSRNDQPSLNFRNQRFKLY